VVGAGSAGCCIANRLSADPSVSVLLLEAGGKDNNPLIKMGIGFSRLMYDKSVSNIYETQPEPQLGGRRVHVVRGRVMGGCSSINGQVYMRGQRQDYDDWAALPGCEGWSYDELLPYFRKSEHYEPGPASDYHGKGGELNVTYPSWQYDITDAYLDAAVSVGIPRNDDLNGENQEGIGLMQLNQKDRQRWSSADAFLSKAVKARPNLRITLHAITKRVLLEGKRAVGVEYLDKQGRAQVVKAKREVILAAGAYNTPPLLELSGVGDPAVLAALGVPVQHALPGVGANLQDHYQAWMQMGVKNARTLSDDGKMPRLLWTVLRYLFTKTGPLTFPACNVGAFIPNQDAHLNGGRPMFQIHFSPGAGSQDEDGNMVAAPVPGVNATITYLRPTARGSVHASSTDPKAFPTIKHNYLGTEHDRALALEAFKLLRGIYGAPVFQQHATSEILPGDHVQTDEQILDYWKREGMSVYHPVGTAKMGASTDDMAVVDEQLRVHGVTGLRVVDASVFPLVPSGNTHAPTVAMAERACDLILGKPLLAAHHVAPVTAPAMTTETGAQA
jgi:choline dehydrogenase